MQISRAEGQAQSPNKNLNLFQTLFAGLNFIQSVVGFAILAALFSGCMPSKNYLAS